MNNCIKWGYHGFTHTKVVSHFYLYADTKSCAEFYDKLFYATSPQEFDKENFLP